MSRLPVKVMQTRRFGEKLHALRIERGMTLKGLASALGYTAHGYVSEIEAGKKTPTVGFVLGVAHLFNVTTDELLRDDLELKENESRHG